MRIGLHHCLLIILLIAVAQVLVAGAPSSKSRINIRASDEENCTRIGDQLICPCNVSINGTYYPCWLPLTNATVPSPNNTCSECPIGSYSNNKTGNCTMDNICPMGSCLEPYRCDLCSIGTYSNTTGAIECTSCPAGFVARDLGSQNCTACPPGYSTNGYEGSSGCIGCVPGAYSNNWGTPFCELCDFGEYSAGKSESCSKCPKGTYNDKRGQSYDGCIGCGAGYWGVAIGLTSQSQCTVCPGGFYCPEAITLKPFECPRGSYCQEGSRQPIACRALYDSDSGVESCKPSVGFFIVIFGSVCFAAVGFVIIWRWRVVKREKLQEENYQTEIDKLIPKPRDGPVYKGL